MNDSDLIWIDSSNDPRIAHFVGTKDGDARERGEILLDSALVVQRAFAAGLLVKEIFATEAFYQKSFADITAPPSFAQMRKFTASPQILEQVVGYRLHQGVMAIAQRPGDFPLFCLGERIVVLNGLNNAENVGAIIRNCHAFGVDSMIVDGQSCSPWVRRAIRVSMGSAFLMKFHHSPDLAMDLKEMSLKGYQLLAAANAADAKPLSAISFKRRAALVIGGEFVGVAGQILDLSDDIVRIPVAATIDSLNAAVASGILLYHMTHWR